MIKRRSRRQPIGEKGDSDKSHGGGEEGRASNNGNKGKVCS